MKTLKIHSYLFLCANLFFSLLHGVFTPRVSIITSVYKGERFMEVFMKDITSQTIFDECELIIINANSPENEAKFIQPYVDQYPNIIYIKLDADPGLYGVWNMGIKMARAPYITNANVDDALHPQCYEIHARELDKHPEIDLVYSPYLITKTPNQTFFNNTAEQVFNSPEFSLFNMKYCLPNNHPMWRKSMHEKYGYFDQTYRSAGDYEFWVRAAFDGSVFKKINQVLALMYFNGQGLACRPESWIAQEQAKAQQYFEYRFSQWYANQYPKYQAH